MKRALITTTIHTGLQLGKWASQLGHNDIIIVAGDHRSPHAELRSLVNWFETQYGVRSIYLDPETQEHRFPRTSKAIPWNCIQRRNLALLEALSHRPDYVITIDDDNVPAVDNWVERVDAIMFGDPGRFTVRAEEIGWWDPGRLNKPHSVFRGFPIEWRHKTRIAAQEWDEDTDREVKGIDRRPIGVFQSMILGDPDVDAVERIVRNPTVGDVIGDVICERGTWAPFNSQATVWHRDVAPLMFMWPFVGRYDDIWAAYTARAIMDPLGWHVRYGHPLVRQERNAHNVMTDLRLELLGMEHNLDVTRTLRVAGERLTEREVTTPITTLHLVYEALSNLTFLPRELFVAFDAWLTDITDLETR